MATKRLKTEIATQEMSDPLNPLFVDCLLQLSNIQHRIREFYKNSPDKQCIEELFARFDNQISSSAHYLSDIAGSDLLSNTFYHGNNSSK